MQGEAEGEGGVEAGRELRTGTSFVDAVKNRC